MPDSDTAHVADDHAADGHGDEHASEALGPIDLRAWAAAAIGASIAIALVIVMFLVIEG
jgi:hypothetical protein